MVHKNSFFLIFLSSLVIFAGNIFPTDIIVDFDDWIIHKDTKMEFWEVGPSNFFGWYNPARIKEDYFKHLDLVMPHRPDCPIIIRDGCVLPQIICDWLTNKQPAHEIKATALNGLKNLAKNSGKKTKISQAIADYVFSPDRYARTMVVEKKGKELLKRCCEKRDASGKKANRVFLITNWNAESFALLYNNPEIREILSWFDGIMYSGKEHMAQPDPLYFEHAFKEFGIDPNQQPVLYLNSEITNITAAQKLGKKLLSCIHCKDLNFRHIENELKRFNALK